MKCLLVAALLLPASLPCQQESEGVPAELARIDAEYREAHRQWLAAQVKVARGGVPDPSVPTVPPTKVYVDRCLLAARQNRGTKRAEQSLTWILKHASDERLATLRALDWMLTHHRQSPGWNEVLPRFPHIAMLVNDLMADRALGTLLEGNPHPGVLEGVRFSRAMQQLLRAGDDAHRVADEFEEALGELTDPELRRRAEALLASVDRPGHRVVTDDHVLAVQVAETERKLLLVSFTGHLCVTCRTMEQDVFGRPAVAEVLERLVESRLHVDVPGELAKARFEANRELQQGFRGGTDFLAVPVIPMYVIVDPSTGRPIRMLQLRGKLESWEGDFLAFLKGENGRPPR